MSTQASTAEPRVLGNISTEERPSIKEGKTRRRGDVTVRVSFEVHRLAPTYLATAYEHLVPLRRGGRRAAAGAAPAAADLRPRLRTQRGCPAQPRRARSPIDVPPEEWIGVPVPIVGIISDGQEEIRQAVAHTLPGIPHQLCQFHYLREATRPLYEADRHAKTELKKQIRGVRPIERSLEGQDDPEAEAVRGYCLAVRSALTDTGRPPLDAPGLTLRDRLQAIHASIARVAEKRGCPAP